MTYSLDYRKQVLKSLADGMTFAEAASFYDISPTYSKVEETAA
ncbi:hypothetical protein [Psychrobacter sp. WY6]